MDNTPQENNPVPSDPQITPISPPVGALVPVTIDVPTEPVVIEPTQSANPFFGSANTSNQPAPVAAPVTFVTPTDPATTDTVASAFVPIAGVPTPPVKKKMSKKITLLITGGAVLLLVVATVILYFIYFNITKEDYQNAATAGTELVKLEAKSRESLQAFTGTAGKQPHFETVESVTSAMNNATDSLATYETAVKAYGSQKALHDGDVQKLYETFKKKYSVYTNFSSAYSLAASKATTALTKCSADLKNTEYSRSYDDYKKQSDTCRADLVSAQGVSDPDWKNLLNAYVTYLDSSTPFYKTIYAVSTSIDLTATYAAINDLNAISKTFTDATRIFIANVSDRYKATDGVTASLIAVTDLLNKKAE